MTFLSPSCQCQCCHMMFEVACFIPLYLQKREFPHKRPQSFKLGRHHAGALSRVSLSGPQFVVLVSVCRGWYFSRLAADRMFAIHFLPSCPIQPH